MTNIEAWEPGLERPVVALTDQQRQAFPHIIYRQETEHPEDAVTLRAAADAITAAGIPVELDIDWNEEAGTEQTVVRTATEERREHSAESALFHGTSSALSRMFGDVPADQAAQAARTAAEAMVSQITEDERLFESFKGFYGGSLWTANKERFTNDIFVATATFDAELLDETLTGGHVRQLMFKLDDPDTFSRGRDLYDKEPHEIFAELPTLDYHQLEDEAFRQSLAGQALEKAYAELIGEQAAWRQKQYRWVIDAEGELIPAPMIPLAKVPVVESLMIDQVSQTKPRGDYVMTGPQDVTDLVLDSDSEAAIQAFTDGILRRLQPEDRNIHDGPDEFQQKANNVHSMLRIFSDSETPPERRASLQGHLLTILEAFTGDGAIAQEIRSEYEASERSSWMREPADIRRIIGDTLKLTLTTPEAEIFLGRCMPDFEKSLVLGEKDPLTLSHNEHVDILLDAIRAVDGETLPHVFELMGVKVFGDREFASRLRHIVELRVAASQALNVPEVRLAHEHMRSFSLVFDDEKKNPDYLAAEHAVEDARAPGDALFVQAADELNQLFLDQLTQLADAGAFLGPNKEAAETLFDKFLRHMNLGDSLYLQKLPTIYYDLLALVERDDVSDSCRSSVMWKYAEAMQYRSGDAAANRMLLTVVLDTYRLMLGTPDNMRLPSDHTSRGLAAANHAASRGGAFKAATETELALLVDYKLAFGELVDRIIASDRALGDGTISTESPEDSAQLDDRMLLNLERIASAILTLESHYEQYLYIEDVKRDPKEYYMWLLNRVQPFWAGMQGEVKAGIGYSSSRQPDPTATEIHGMLKHHITSNLILDPAKMGEDFDVFKDGGLDSFLLDCQRLLSPYAAGNIPTVWREGKGFLLSMITHMPEELLERFRQQYGAEHDFVQYVEKTRAHFVRKTPEDGETTVL
jgi:hypothetical protein